MNREGIWGGEILRRETNPPGAREDWIRGPESGRLVRTHGSQEQSGDEVAAEAKGAFGGASGPDRAEIDANGRKNWDMENREEALR